MKTLERQIKEDRTAILNTGCNQGVDKNGGSVGVGDG